MIIPPNTADVMEKPMKTPACKIKEKQVSPVLRPSGLFFELYNIFYHDPTVVIILRIKTLTQDHRAATSCILVATVNIFVNSRGAIDGER